MEKMRRCKQCGEIKPETQFREYSNAKGRYRTCKSCERINNRHKYLRNKPTPTETDLQEVEAIEELYMLLQEEGLKPPSFTPKTLLPDVLSLIESHKSRREPVVKDLGYVIPHELMDWLQIDLSGYTPDELTDGVAEELLTKYRPQLGIDPKTLLPIYDETHKQALDEIFKRFDDYEDNYNWDE